MTAIPPPTPDYLVQLFEDVDFIAEVEPDHKLCLQSRSYANRDSNWHAIYRLYAGETGLKSAEFVKTVARGLSQSIDTCTDERFRQVLYGKALELRLGIKRLIATYRGNQGSLRILRPTLGFLELKLPDDIKVRHGIPLHDGSIGISPPAVNDDHCATDADEDDGGSDHR